VGALAAIGSGRPLRAEVKVDSGTFGGLEARAIGPAVMGGRISALDAFAGDRLTVYAGAAGGGVWKSVDGGTTFKPVFEKHAQSIGAITIDRSKPEIVWVGTGEPWTRNSVSIGDGLYKTTDGGENWEHLGLRNSERISEIVIHPTNNDTVYVCVTGHLWNAHPERGVYKTTDGGKNWEQILFVDENTGCSDLAMDLQEPNILYAGMWQFRRWPYFFKSGGPGGGLHKSTDGGKTWRRITQGLPQGELGRIAVAVAPSRPNVVYANVEAEKTALYRSDDLGETWRWAGADANVESRPFYFSLLLVDPKDHKRVYKPGTTLSVSTDGGESFSQIGGGTHPDHHALWIHPQDSDELLAGTDGGVYASHDRGIHWTFLKALPVSQFYHVSFDSDDPYNVYGGLQDNGTWFGPSSAAGGVRNRAWENIGSGDGFRVFVDPKECDIAFLEWQGGRVQRVRKSTGEAKDIQPLPTKDDPKYRFNWNTPIALSPNRPDTVYVGAQFLFRTRDRGDSWQKLSPDLTTNDPQKQKQSESGGLTVDNSTAENHGTIYAISESPKNENVIWVGTDDGNVQVTKDGGKTWTNVVGNISGLPHCTWVSSVEASRHTEGTAYVTFDGHTQGDMTAYAYKTTDFGKTWTALAKEPIEGYCHAIREDLVSANLLFLGTELGLFITIDGGTQWARFEGKVPKVAVREIAIHPREHDLILATHGRGILIVDDITPLRQLTSEVLESEVALLDTRPAIARIPASEQCFSGDDEYVGPNPSPGAQITYYLKQRHLMGDMKLEVLDGQGNLLSNLPTSKRRGINRVAWSMRSKPPKVPPAASLVPQFFAFLGPQVPEGSYTVKLTKGTETREGKVQVMADPRAGYTTEGKGLQDATVMKLYGMLGRLTFVVDSILDLQAKIKDRLGKLPADGALAAKLKQFHEELDAFRKTLVATRKGGMLAGEEQLRERLSSLYGSINGFEGPPTQSQTQYADVLLQQLDEAEKRFDSMTSPKLDELNPELRTNNQTPINRMTKAEWEAKQAGS